MKPSLARRAEEGLKLAKARRLIAGAVSSNKTVPAGVSAELIEAHAAVSREVAEAMARSGIACSDIALSITGVAGPQPGEDGNPSGLVHLAAACRDGRVSHVERFSGMLNPHTDFYSSAIRNRSINCELTMPAREHPKARSSRCETF